MQVGLVEELSVPYTADGTNAPAVRNFGVHPGIAEAGRSQAGKSIPAAEDFVLGAYWGAWYKVGLERKSAADSTTAALAGSRAFPYLVRLQESALAGAMLERVIHRDRSPTSVAAVVPVVRRIAEATKGTDHELPSAALLARVLQVASRGDEAEAQLREVLSRAAECGHHRLASGIVGDLINLLERNGRTEEALGLIPRMKEFTQRAGLGPWTELGDDMARLQLLARLGRPVDVLTEFEALRARMGAPRVDRYPG